MTDVRSGSHIRVPLAMLGSVLLAACSAEVTQGEPAFVRLALTARPKGFVTIAIAASDPTEVTVVPSQLTFRPNDWQSPKTVTVRATDDAAFDGDKPVRLTFSIRSPDRCVSSYTPPPVEVLSVDDDYTVTGYVARDLFVGSTSETGVSGINNRGQVIGSFYTPEQIVHPFLWQNGAATDVGSLGNSQSFAVDINDAGVVLGWSDTLNGVTRFLFENGELRTTPGEVMAINDLGHTIGEALYADGQRIELPNFGSGPAEASAINERDHATGFARRPFLWADGQLTDLGTFGGPAGRGLSINEHDQIVGWMFNADIVPRAFLYARGRAIDLGTVGGVGSIATSINNRGDIVGADSVGLPEEGWVGRPGELTSLRSLLVDGSCFQIIDPIEINDGGYIAANAWNCDESTRRAVLLEPIKTAR